MSSTARAGGRWLLLLLEESEIMADNTVVASQALGIQILVPPVSLGRIVGHSTWTEPQLLNYTTG